MSQTPLVPAHNTNNTYVPALTFLPKQNDSLCITSTHQFEYSASVTKHHTHFLPYMAFAYLPLHLPDEITPPTVKDHVSCAISRRKQLWRLHSNA